jgi:hypothetical protein
MMGEKKTESIDPSEEKIFDPSILSGFFRFDDNTFHSRCSISLRHPTHKVNQSSGAGVAPRRRQAEEANT